MRNACTYGGLIAQRERPSDERLVAAKLGLPKSVTQYDEPATVRRILLRGEGGARNQRRTEEVEVTLGYVNAPELVRAVSSDVEAGP